MFPKIVSKEIIRTVFELLFLRTIFAIDSWKMANKNVLVMVSTLPNLLSSMTSVKRF